MRFGSVAIGRGPRCNFSGVEWLGTLGELESEGASRVGTGLPCSWPALMNWSRTELGTAISGCAVLISSSNQLFSSDQSWYVVMFFLAVSTDGVGAAHDQLS